MTIRTLTIMLLWGFGAAGLSAAEPLSAAWSPTDYTLLPRVHAEEVETGPAHIVSIAPSITEMCAALGLAQRVVGRTQYCTHPPSVRQAAIVGAYTDTNYEQIFQLRPDIILITDSSPKVAQRLQQLRLPFASVPDSTLEDIYIAIEQLGRVLQRPRTAATLVDALRQDINRLSTMAGDHRGTRVLFTFSPLPPRPAALYIAGPGGYLDALLRAAGYTNAVAGSIQESWSHLSLEALVALKPDFILEVRPPDQDLDVDRLYGEWSDLDLVPAIQRRRVRSLRNTAVARPGPRINITLQEIITVLSE